MNHGCAVEPATHWVMGRDVAFKGTLDVSHGNPLRSDTFKMHRKDSKCLCSWRYLQAGFYFFSACLQAEEGLSLSANSRANH